jgi:polyribonucleotide 5'-hydroxyl-kinase
VPLVFYYGHTTPSDAPELYRYLVDRMASVLDRRAESSPEVGAAG